MELIPIAVPIGIGTLVVALFALVAFTVIKRSIRTVDLNEALVIVGRGDVKGGPTGNLDPLPADGQAVDTKRSPVSSERVDLGASRSSRFATAVDWGRLGR